MGKGWVSWVRLLPEGRGTYVHDGSDQDRAAPAGGHHGCGQATAAVSPLAGRVVGLRGRQGQQRGVIGRGRGAPPAPVSLRLRRRGRGFCVCCVWKGRGVCGLVCGWVGQWHCFVMEQDGPTVSPSLLPRRPPPPFLFFWEEDETCFPSTPRPTLHTRTYTLPPSPQGHPGRRPPATTHTHDKAPRRTPPREPLACNTPKFGQPCSHEGQPEYQDGLGHHHHHHQQQQQHRPPRAPVDHAPCSAWAWCWSRWRWPHALATPPSRRSRDSRDRSVL